MRNLLSSRRALSLNDAPRLELILPHIRIRLRISAYHLRNAFRSRSKGLSKKFCFFVFCTVETEVSINSLILASIIASLCCSKAVGECLGESREISFNRAFLACSLSYSSFIRCTNSSAFEIACRLSEGLPGLIPRVPKAAENTIIGAFFVFCLPRRTKCQLPSKSALMTGE